MGSEKGNPTSIMSAPAFGNSNSNLFDIEKFGSYADINDTKAFLLIFFKVSNFSFNLLTKTHPFEN